MNLHVALPVLAYLALAGTLTIGYVVLMAAYLRTWTRLPETASGQFLKNDGLLSVVIPARNEAGNIEDCLRSVMNQDIGRDRYEIIVVDDHSEDDTAELASGAGPDVRVVRMSEVQLPQGEYAFKKRAIEAGVAAAKGVYVVVTDADCTHHVGWLRSMSEALSDGADLVTGPVLYRYRGKVFHKFQALDGLGMTAVTGASLGMGMLNLASGANLAFRKRIFEELGGYRGIDRTASGDDMLLVHKFGANNPKGVRYLKSRRACVYTSPSDSLGSFLRQRMRWASKLTEYQDVRVTATLIWVYLVNVTLLANVVLSLVLGGFWLPFSMAQILVVSLADFLLLRNAAGYFGEHKLMTAFLPSKLLHVGYVLAAGAMGNLFRYEWKGRIPER